MREQRAKLMESNVAFQSAWVVSDLETAVLDWIHATGVGPWYTRPRRRLDNVLYRGVPAELEISTAIAYQGAMQLELIQQHSAGPSAYRDSIPEGASGMHHVARWSGDIDADISTYADIGIEVAMEASSAGMRVVYMDTRPLIGCMTELIDRDSGGAMRARLAIAAESAVGWDGTNPVRTF
jgi:hypothetical protein